jgi:hypothetical protein
MLIWSVMMLFQNISQVRTLCLGILTNILSQVLLPLQRFLLRHYAPYDSHTSLSQFAAESLGRIIKRSKVNFWDDFTAELNDERDLLPQIPKKALPTLAYFALVPSD